MGWKPKTIFGKILKGATIGVAGVAAVATGVGAIAGVVGGGGLLAGAAGGIGTAVKVAKGIGAGTKKVLSKVSAGAVKLVTGESKENLKLIQDTKKQAKEAKDKLDTVKKLVSAGMSESKALQSQGIDPNAVEFTPDQEYSSMLPESAKESLSSIMPGKINPTFIYAGLGIAALLLLPKILKR